MQNQDNSIPSRLARLEKAFISDRKENQKIFESIHSKIVSLRNGKVRQQKLINDLQYQIKKLEQKLLDKDETKNKR